MKIEQLEKIDLCHLPTPIHTLDNMTKKIGKTKMLIKRDDLTGIGFGGNKLRKLEYILKKAIDEGYTTILTYGGVQTNHGRLTVAAAAKLGLKSIIMFYGKPPKKATGNLLLDKIMGADLYFMDTTDIDKIEDLEERAEAYNKFAEKHTNEVIRKYEEKGEKVFSIPIGGSTSLGTAGYITAVKEIMEQLEEMNEKVDYLVSGLGSAGTFTGLYLGAKYYNAPFKVIGSYISSRTDKQIDELIDFMNEVSNFYEMGIEVKREDIIYNLDYIGVGYNVPDKETREVIYELAREEGIFTDPCYTGKAFRCFIDLIKNETIPKDSTALFIHTGGKPGLYSDEHLLAMQDELWNKDTETVFR